MIDKELLSILACPETKKPVHLAPPELLEQLNGRIRRGEVSNRGGQKVESAIDGGLVRADGAFVYPIDDGIPIMLIDAAIPLTEADTGTSAQETARAKRPHAEAEGTQDAASAQATDP